jgi:CRISPR-associated protein Cmr2
MPKYTHLALVLSPVYATIKSARKTRELWASSFVFSRTMYHLLNTLPFGKIIAPAFSAQIEHKFGAGLYHDRCIIQLSEEDSTPDVESWLNQAFAALKGEMGKTQVRDLIQVQVLRIDASPQTLTQTAYGQSQEERTTDAVPIHRINRLLDNLELRPHYQPREQIGTLVEVLDNRIHDLYERGYRKEDRLSIFIKMNKGNAAKGELRLPSVPEIALRPFRNHPVALAKAAYRELVEAPTNFRVKVLKKVGGRSKDLPKNILEAVERNEIPHQWLKKFEDSQLLNELLYAYLKERFREDDTTMDLLKLRHKYFAVVQLDGDGMGKAITALSADDENHAAFGQFSSSLLAYAQAAVEKVIDYGGLPIFSGGDDLLFLAPVAMPPEEASETQTNQPKNVFALCQQLDQLFKKTIGRGVSLSGGVSINYYKYPLGEAVDDAETLEREAKQFAVYLKDQVKGIAEKDWPAKHKKNALTFRVRKHSGQTFGTTF